MIVGLLPWEVLSFAPGRVALSEGHAYGSTSGDVGTSTRVLSYLSLPAVLRRSASPRLFGAGHLARNPDRSARICLASVFGSARASRFTLGVLAIVAPPLHACTLATCF